MIRHELLTSTIRFYIEASDDPFAQYDMVCTIVWETPNTVWLRAMHGTMTRKLLREFVQFLVDNKVKTVRAHRSMEGTLPFTTARTEHNIEIDVDAAYAKMTRRKLNSILT